MTTNKYLTQCQTRVNKALEYYLPKTTQSPTHLHSAMRYAVLNGGKRIRPTLVYAAGEAFGATLKTLDIPAASIELIHCYSLVHDDLPAMDNDDWRRGNPTCHKAFDEATAILCGDALQTLAFELLATGSMDNISEQHRLLMIKTLTQASGSMGMAGGQALDLIAHQTQLTLKDLENIHHLKTGALFSASIKLGAITAGIKEYQALDNYAEHIGLAFQIQDDIRDGMQDTTTPQMTPSYVELLGEKKSRELTQKLCTQAKACLHSLDQRAAPLHHIADFILNRIG